MYALAETLRPIPFTHVEVIAHASVPIIKACTPRGVKCDISVGTDNGLRSSTAMTAKM